MFTVIEVWAGFGQIEKHWQPSSALSLMLPDIEIFYPVPNFLMQKKFLVAFGKFQQDNVSIF